MGQQTPALYQVASTDVVPVALLADFTGYSGNAGLAGTKLAGAGGERRGFRFTAGSMISVVGFRFLVGGSGVFVVRGVVPAMAVGFPFDLAPLWRQGQGSALVEAVSTTGAITGPRFPHDDGTALDILVQPNDTLYVVSFDQNQPAQFSVLWRELQGGGAGP